MKNFNFFFFFGGGGGGSREKRISIGVYCLKGGGGAWTVSKFKRGAWQKRGKWCF